MLHLGQKGLEMAVYVKKYNSSRCFVLRSVNWGLVLRRAASGYCLYHRGEKRKKRENSVKRSFVLCTVRQILLDEVVPVLSHKGIYGE
jgi:hypothetical protein